MSFQLRPYQDSGVNLLSQELAKGIRTPLLFLATGGGKGLIMAEIAHKVLSNGKRIIIVMRRSQLVHQAQENFFRYRGIKASVVMGTVKGFDINNRCQICSIDTIRARMNNPKYDFLKEFDVCLIDEGHDINSPSYQNFIDWLGEKILIPGMTATPFAMGGKPLKTWKSCVKPIEMDELRDQGYLAPVKVFSPSVIDTSKIKIVNGDYSSKELYERVTDKKIIGDIVDNYKKYGNDKPAILFAVNKQHSMLMAHAFNEAGIPAIHQEDSHSQEERKAAIKGLIDGVYKILCNVNIFSTGTDIPEAFVGIMARPTLSEVLYVQQVGRLLRIFPGKDFATILDHAGNTYRHGLPYDRRDHDLAEFATKKSKKYGTVRAVPVKTCPGCYAVISSAFAQCPECNHEFQVKEKIKTADGELEEVTDSGKNFKLIARLNKLKSIETIKGWKPNAKYFMLYEEFGDAIYEYTDAPQWVGDLWRKACPVCKKSSIKTSGHDFYKCNECSSTYTATNNKKELIKDGTETRAAEQF